MTHYSRDLRPAKWASGIILDSSNSRRLQTQEQPDADIAPRRDLLVAPYLRMADCDNLKSVFGCELETGKWRKFCAVNSCMW